MIGVLRTRPTWFGWLAAVVMAASACSGDDPVPPPPEPTVPTRPPAPAPKVTVPQKVELTEEGSELALGATASAIYQADRTRVSVIDVRVRTILEGSIERDFATFDLPDKVRQQTPYYVKVTVINQGPAPLGGAAVPVYALDSTATYFPATTLLGTLTACPGGPLPEPFAPKQTQSRCLLFLVQPGEKLEEVQLRPYRGYDPVSWTVPRRIERYPPEPDRPDRPRNPRTQQDRG